MWPWEHVAVAYLAYSGFRRLRGRGPPDDRTALVVVVAALIPDLVDKPLSWTVGLFPAGYAIGHSLFVWIAVFGVIMSVESGRRELGLATLVGAGSHLAGDVAYPLLKGEGLAVERVLWPLVTLPPYEVDLGLLARTLSYLHRFAGRTLAGEVGVVIWFQLGLMLVVIAVWVYDGMPGTRPT